MSATGLAMQRKPRVTRSKGMRLSPMGDGTAVEHEMRGATRVPFWLGDHMPERDRLATERARDRAPEIVQKATYERIVRVEESYERVLPVKKAQKSVSSGKGRAKVAQSVKSGASRADRNAQVDSVIRKTGYTGPITPQMRKLARDVVSHRESVARYAA